MINNTETTIKDGGGGGTTNTPTGNGGSTFVCSKCGRTCDCGNMSVEVGYSLWGCQEWGTTERLTHVHICT